METKSLDEVLQDSIAAELKLWSEEQSSLKTSHDYETAFTARARRINQLLLQVSVSDGCKERDKKK
jgi:hypothetical protein